MKFYDCKTAPSPRRVRIFIAEKGLDIETQEVDLRSGAQFADEFRALNPRCTVPVLALEDGTAICDSNPICQYLEETHPEPALMGIDAKDRALVTMWNQRMENEGFMAIAETFRNATPGLKGRALTGPANFAQIPELGERGRARAELFLGELDTLLADRDFIAGPRFTIADITALVAVDFAGWIKLSVPDDAANLKRWRGAVSTRPSAAV